MKIEGLLGSIHTYVAKHMEDLVEGEKLLLKIMEVKEEYNRLVLIHHSVWLRISQLQIGQIVSGTIQCAKDYGSFVDIGDFKAFLPTSCVNNPSNIFKVGDSIEAAITKLDIETGRVVLKGFENLA
ncbi:S1 RNA-binding domain-containing protein [Merismopedia glauca]|nr:S1 RNA-binding domain-containing protein [Merismopedia glauca]